MGEPDIDALNAIVADCEEYGLPMAAEMLVTQRVRIAELEAADDELDEQVAEDRATLKEQAETIDRLKERATDVEVWLNMRPGEGLTPSEVRRVLEMLAASEGSP